MVLAFCATAAPVSAAWVAAMRPSASCRAVGALPSLTVSHMSFTVS
jgi:hypothetical protein